MKEGYLLIALGPERYREMALACAASLRFWDKVRPIQLVTDRSMSNYGALVKIFDEISIWKGDESFSGPLIKLRMNKMSVFDKTMFVDTDCLMLRDDIDNYWNELARSSVSTPGRWASSGVWYGMDIAEICYRVGLKRLVTMNSGAFYFDRSSTADGFFNQAVSLLHSLGNFTGHTHRGLGPPDEPFFGIAFGKLGIEPFRSTDKNGNAWMLSTIDASNFELTAFSGLPRFTKGGIVSPTICHFVGSTPAEIYRHLCEDYIANIL